MKIKTFRKVIEANKNPAERIKKDWEKIAGEKLDVEEMKGTVYAYGSELATLRLLKKYIKSGDKVKADYSSNLKKFYFRLELM